MRPPVPRSAPDRHPGSPGRRQPQVFARDVRLPDDAPLVYLDRGSAACLRGDTRADHLQCPLPTCEDPRLTTRSGPTVRDHFAHLVRTGGDHSPETLAHHTAKHLLGRHLRRAYPDAEVHVDDVAVDSGARPDVLLRLASGREIAYEVQYAALTPQRWQERHQRYAAGNIRDVWLFGGNRYQHRPRYRGASEQARIINPTLAAVLGSGHPLLLIDSAIEQVALGGGHDVVTHFAAEQGRGEHFPRWFPLTAARWPQGVIELPGMRQLLDDVRPYRLNLQTRQKQADEGRRIVEEHEHARAESEAAWQLKRQVLENHRGILPAVIDVGLPVGEIAGGEKVIVGVRGETTKLYPLDTYPQAAWRWRLLHMLECHLGTTVSCSTLQQEAFPARPTLSSPDAPYDALLGSFLEALRTAGYVWFSGSRQPAPGEGVLILGSADTLPQMKGRYARHSLLEGPPVTLMETLTHTVLWQSHTSIPRTTRNRPGLPPGLTGRRGDRRGSQL